MLSINAFNALLKTLEEPPAHAKFIFATTEPHKIPITILSRCQRFDFKKIGLIPLQARLRHIVDQENIQIEESGLAIIARSGGGSMRDALSTLDQVISFCGDKISDDELQGLLGLVSRSLLLATIRAILQREASQLLGLVQKVDEHGHSFRQFCQQLVELVRALVVVKVVGKPGDLIDVGESELQEIKSLAEPATLEDLQRLLTILVRTEADLAVSNYPRLTMEMVLVKLASLPAGIEVATLIKRLEDLEKQLSSGVVEAPVRKQRTVEDVAAPPPVDVPLAEEPPSAQSVALPTTGTAEKDWAGLVDFVKNHRKPRISSLLEQSSVLLLDLPRLRIGMPEMYFSLADGDMRQEIQTLAADYFATEVKVEVEKVGNGEKAPLSLHAERAQQESDRKKKLRENAVEHPLVKSALNIFGGQIEDVKPIDKGFV